MPKLPKISVITPTYNQAAFIERTITSVLNQNYPNLEYIIVDGQSTDDTDKIVRKYQKALTYISEPDGGQSEAINKGLRKATGDIVTFLNSDDTYEPGALRTVATYFSEHPGTQWLYGKCRIIDEHDHEVRRPITSYKNMLLKNYSYNKLLAENYISQPATFWRREVHAEVGYFDEENHWCMDYDFWLRLGQHYPAAVIPVYLANFRYHYDSKSGQVNNKQFQTELEVARRYKGKKEWPLLLHQLNYLKIVGVYKLLYLFRR